MRNPIRNLFVMLLLGLLPVMSACASDGGTGPGPLAQNVEVGYVQDMGCSRLDTPMDSVDMGTIEFKNNTDAPVMASQIAIKLVASTPASVPMYFFGATYRSANNGIIPNLDAQQDSEASYIMFDVLPTIPPGGTFRAKVRGSVPDPSPGLYGFSMIADSVKAKTATGGSAEIKMGPNTYTLAIKATCP